MVPYLLVRKKNPAINNIIVKLKPANKFFVIPEARWPARAMNAIKSAYGTCVATCSRWGHEAPVEERIVVSDIGEE